MESSTGGNGVKRWVFTIFLFLLLGVIVNITLAWGISVRGDPFDSEPAAKPYLLDEGERSASRFRTGGSLAYHWSTRCWLARRSDPPGSYMTLGDVLPSWGRHADDSYVEMNMVIASGWPFLALWYHQTVWSTDSPTLQTHFQAHGGIQLKWRYAGFIHRPCVLPLRPIWFGFIVNTVLYALILSLLYCVLFVLRRRIHLKRGRCPKCGYDLRHALSGGCPECGWNRQPEATP
jgi:hypothetical protein